MAHLVQVVMLLLWRRLIRCVTQALANYTLHFSRCLWACWLMSLVSLMICLAATFQTNVQEMATMVGIDLDPTAHAIAGARLQTLSPTRPNLGVHLLHGNYRWVTGRKQFNPTNHAVSCM